jgi:hypothetical protein
MEMGKPFSMQAPEDVAKEYGGNKQSIAKAAQMGLLDPTTAVMAGMFIDRMRDAQAQEQVPQQTIAEQTFACSHHNHKVCPHKVCPHKVCPHKVCPHKV